MSDLSGIKPGTLNPADLKPLAEVKFSSREEVAVAVQAARAAQVGWAQTPRSKREQALRNFVQVLLTRREEGMKVMADETGRDPLENLMSDLVGAGDFVNMVINASHKALATEPVRLNR
jgi:acyl-CoA reductase-like NAD-dependent aldehyde dehydrogenase